MRYVASLQKRTVFWNRHRFVTQTTRHMSHQRTPPPFLYEPKTLRSPDVIVHLEYDPESLDSVSGPGWTRFVCISDTHARRFTVPDGDVLLHSGDLTNTGTLEEFKTTIDWLCQLPHKVKMCVEFLVSLPSPFTVLIITRVLE